MAGIFQNGVYDMGFDMKPSSSQVFTQNSGLGTSLSTTTPYTFGYSFNIGEGVGILLGTNLTTVITGFYYYCTGLASSGTQELINFYDSTAGGIQVSLRVSSTGTLQFYLGSSSSTTIGSASAANTVVADTWVYIEAAVTISATVGQVTCNVNGASVITTAASQDTKSTANTFVNCLQFSELSGSSLVDDWYILDNTGSAPFNAMLGVVQVRGDAASANSAHSRNQFTATNPTNVNHSNVANIPASASEYNYDDNPGDYDMFAFTSLPSTVATVLAVDVWAVLGLDSSGARTVGLDCYSNGTDNLGSAFTPAAIGSPTYYNLVNTVDPHTSSAWTVSNAGAAELGVKVVS
jgi:hypothetical protein